MLSRRASRLGLFFACTFILALGAVIDATAQHPRMVLIEEATNASCPPCAAQNPSFEHFLMEADVRERAIPVIWHSRFPGRDVMNAANSTMHNARVSYNSVSGVPMATINGRTPTTASPGWYAGAPGDIESIQSHIDAVPATSPILVEVEQTREGNEVTAEVRVTTAEEVGLRKLYIAVVEGYHYYTSAGTNGEKEFRWIARKMLPADNGSPINVRPQNEIVQTESFTLDPEWNADQIYVVAWLQNDATKEVLQVGTSRTMLSAEIDRPTTERGSEELPGSWDIGLETGMAGEYELKITKDLPTGWQASVQHDGVAIDDEGRLQLSSVDPAMLALSIIPSSEKSLLGVGEVTVEVTGPQGAHFVESFRLYSDEIKAIVLTRDGGDPRIAPYYSRALQAGDYVYAVVAREDEDLFDWTDQVVIMEVGKWALEVADIAALRSAIDAGGTRLFMIGAEIGYGLGDIQNQDPRTPYDPAFMRDYLHATYESDDNPATQVNGAPGDPIGNGLSFSITTGVQNQDTPDQLGPVGDAIASLYYGTNPNHVAGLRYADEKNRLVYFGFGAEGIGSESDRAELLRRGVAWLLSSETTGIDETHENAGLLTVQLLNAQPADREIVIGVTTPAGAYSLDLYDMKGRNLLHREINNGVSAGDRTTIDAATLANGIYRVVVRTATEVRTLPVIVLR